MTDEESCTALGNPITHSHRASVAVRAATNTESNVQTAPEIVTVRLSTGRRMAFNYNAGAVRRRRANLVANRGATSISTSDAN